jgi:hypothetical protein
VTDFLEIYRKELIELLHKSQDAFEKQLSYIGAGALALSIGFIKDVVKDIKIADARWMLALGWVLLGCTLLVNLISHIVAADKHNKTIGETYYPESWDRTRVQKRYKSTHALNWISVATLILGIFSIIVFVILNTLK